MASYNRVMLMGNLTRDPELRYTPGGAAVCEFSVAVNRKWTGNDGQAKEEVGFFDCVAWARTAEVISEYLKKGNPIFVEGRLTQDRWEQADGQKRSRIRVTIEKFQFIGVKAAGGGTQVPAHDHEAAGAVNDDTPEDMTPF